MKCENKDREEKITLYLDRQLDWKEEKEFLKHISTIIILSKILGGKHC